MSTAIIKINELNKITKDLEATSKNEIDKNFAPIIASLTEFENLKSVVVTDEKDVDGMKKAKENRLEVMRLRTKADKERKRLKEDSLRYGKAIQGVYNFIEFKAKRIEDHCKIQEEFAIRKEFERKEKRRIERTELLLKWEGKPELYQLGDMDQETFDSVLETAELSYKAKLEAEKKAEAERIEAERIEAERIEAEKKAKEAEEKRIREENEKLKKEAEARRILEEKAKKEREEIEEKARIEREKIEAERRKEAEERARLEAELKAKEEEEEKRILAEKIKKEELKKGEDSVKFLYVAEQLDNITFPDIESKYGKELFEKINNNITAMIKILREGKK